MSYSTTRPTRTIAPNSARARQFLYSLVNLRDDPKDALYFKARFGILFLPEVPWASVRHWAFNIEVADISDDPEAVAESCPLGSPEENLLRRYWLLPLRDAIRGIWIEPDLLVKEWGVLTTLANYFTFGDRRAFVAPVQGPLESSFYPTGPPGPCGQIFLHLLKNAHLTRRCENPECPTPYFFAARRSQKYCSADCSIPSQRESERRWWSKNGAEWRRTRLTQQRRAKKNAAKRASEV